MTFIHALRDFILTITIVVVIDHQKTFSADVTEAMSNPSHLAEISFNLFKRLGAFHVFLPLKEVGLGTVAVFRIARPLQCSIHDYDKLFRITSSVQWNFALADPRVTEISLIKVDKVISPFKFVRAKFYCMLKSWKPAQTPHQSPPTNPPLLPPWYPHLQSKRAFANMIAFVVFDGNSEIYMSPPQPETDDV